VTGGVGIASFNQRLQATVDSRRSHLCVGLDLDMSRLPKSVTKDRHGAETFLRAVVESTADHVAAFKPNLAFFLALGKWGFELLLSLREWIPPEIILIGDAKWGDIDNTAEHYSTSAFEVLGFDAVTVNPYQGSDAVNPFLRNESNGALVVCRTSNPSAGEFQDLGLKSPLYVAVAKAASRWNTLGNCGIVVGANEVQALAYARRETPDLSLLIPGVGAQEADLSRCLTELGGPRPATFVINASRSILYAADTEKYWESSAVEAKRLRDTIESSL
jgi:orotidine-5'-phosphate decarboxylase